MFKSRTIQLAGVALLMGVAIYVAFDQFFSEGIPSYAVNIAAAFLGAVITIIITAVLLNAQSLAELGKEKSIGVFQSKLTLYNGFLEFLNDIVMDGEIDEAELRELRGWSLKLSLVAGANATSTIGFFISQTLAIKGFIWDALSDAQKERWFAWYEEKEFEEEPLVDEDDNYTFFSIGRIVMDLKLDLGEEEVSGENAAISNNIVVDDIMRSL